MYDPTLASLSVLPMLVARVLYPASSSTALQSHLLVKRLLLVLSARWNVLGEGTGDDLRAGEDLFSLTSSLLADNEGERVAVALGRIGNGDF